MMRKIKLQSKTCPTLFPSLSDTLQLFNIPAGPADISRLISRETGTPLPVDNKTLKLSEQEGVKRQKAFAIIRYILSHLNTFSAVKSSKHSPCNLDIRRSIREAIYHPGSGKEWALFLPGFLESTQQKFHHAERFLNNRFASEKSLYSFEGNDAERFEYVTEIYSECFLADSTEIRAFCSALINSQNSTAKEIIQEYKNLIGILITDFYFWLLAYIELDIAESIAKEISLREAEQATLDHGLFQRIMPRVEDGQVIYTLHQLFDRWRQLYSDKVVMQEQPISISEFATLLPDALLSDRKVDEMTGEQRKLSKYRMLCSWRAGQKIPSDDKVQAFIENILPPCRERELWFWFAKTAIAIDRLFKKIKAENLYSDDELMNIFQRYSVYHREVRR